MEVKVKLFRVSYYRKSEVVAGRAPRYMIDVESESPTEAANTLLKDEGVIIRSVYKAPSVPIRPKPSYLFETKEARNAWYGSGIHTRQERMCHDCKAVPVARYQRTCPECQSKRKVNKLCRICTNPVSNSRHWYCDGCRKAQKDNHRFASVEKSKQAMIEQLTSQIAWAKDKLATTTLDKCQMSSRFTGSRLPHADKIKIDSTCLDCMGTGLLPDGDGCGCIRSVPPVNRCCACLLKFIEKAEYKIKDQNHMEVEKC
jgi:hypothetical protein